MNVCQFLYFIGKLDALLSVNSANGSTTLLQKLARQHKITLAIDTAIIHGCIHAQYLVKHKFVLSGRYFWQDLGCTCATLMPADHDIREANPRQLQEFAKGDKWISESENNLSLH